MSLIIVGPSRGAATPAETNTEESDKDVTNTEDLEIERWQDEPPNGGTDLSLKGQDRRGGRPPYSDKVCHSKSDNMPYVTRTFIECWDRHGAW